MVGSDYEKVNSVIKSIDSPLQLRAGERMAELLYEREGDALDYFILLAIIEDKRLRFGPSNGEVV